jgi:hypothetical protein
VAAPFAADLDGTPKVRSALKEILYLVFPEEKTAASISGCRQGGGTWKCSPFSTKAGWS